MKKNKVVFVEYSTAMRGQHFMTVILVKDGQRQIIGRVYRKYDKENEKTIYWATDWTGNQIFADVKDLYALKKNFIEHGDTLAMAIPIDFKPRKERDDHPYSENIGKKQSPKEKSTRTKELKQTREKTNNTEKEKEIKVEKEHDNNLEKEHNEKFDINKQDDQKEHEQQREQEMEEVRDNEQDLDQDLER